MPMLFLSQHKAEFDLGTGPSLEGGCPFTKIVGKLRQQLANEGKGRGKGEKEGEGKKKRKKGRKEEGGKREERRKRKKGN